MCDVFLYLLIREEKNQSPTDQKAKPFKATGGWTLAYVTKTLNISTWWSANHFSLITLSLSFNPASPTPYRRSSQHRSSPVLQAHISRSLGCSKQQDLPSAGGCSSWVEALIGGTGDDHYLVVLTQINTPRVQQSLKISQQVLGCLPCYQSLWHCSMSQ